MEPSSTTSSVIIGHTLFAATVIVMSAIAKRSHSSRPSRNWNGNFDSEEEPEITAPMLDFYAKWTGRKPEKEFILSNWRSLKKQFHTYRCIQSMQYLLPRASYLKSYSKILCHLKEKGDIKIADFGCCFGQDIRKLILDGVAPEMITAVDLHDGYWLAGREVFLDNANNEKLNGIKTCFFDISLPLHHPDAIEARFPSSKGTFDFIILQAVLHTMSLEQHKSTLQRIRMLLKKGGIVMGRTVGSDPAKEWVMTPNGQSRRYLHSATSLSDLFKELGFQSWDCSFESRGVEDLSRVADSSSTGKLIEFMAVA